jgi:hypothetical protein
MRLVGHIVSFVQALFEEILAPIAWLLFDPCKLAQNEVKVNAPICRRDAVFPPP